jgi:hypothetical protein
MDDEVATGPVRTLYLSVRSDVPAGAHHLARLRRLGRERDGRGTLYLAQDGGPQASPLAGSGSRHAAPPPGVAQASGSACGCPFQECASRTHRSGIRSAFDGIADRDMVGKIEFGKSGSGPCCKTFSSRPEFAGWARYGKAGGTGRRARRRPELGRARPCTRITPR